MWNQLSADATEEALVQALLAEYAVDEETARADVAAFLGKLRDADLLDE
ncbi:PqqD family protein [Senegalimassilia anaerobia]